MVIKKLYKKGITFMWYISFNIIIGIYFENIRTKKNMFIYLWWIYNFIDNKFI